jgi:hypothetical protein
MKTRIAEAWDSSDALMEGSLWESKGKDDDGKKHGAVKAKDG